MITVERKVNRVVLYVQLVNMLESIQRFVFPLIETAKEDLTTSTEVARCTESRKSRPMRDCYR